MSTGIGVEVRHTKNRKPWSVSGKITLFRTQKQLTREQIVPSQLGNYLYGHTVTWISTSSSIQNIDITPLEIIRQTTSYNFKGIRRHRVIILTPPDTCPRFII